MAELKILELFSGIGGMHSAFNYSNLSGHICAAVDINTVANVVYEFNHPHVKVLNNNIQKLTPKFVEKLGVNMILMSPPCQPFTRVGNQKDIEDNRADALKHLCDILPDCKGIQFILMENVKGFETSRAREMYVKTLKDSRFFVREFILSPSQFGVPNTRHRYYCLARRSDFNFKENNISQELPAVVKPWPSFLVKDIVGSEDTLSSDLLLDDKVLQKRVLLFDIVNPDSSNTTCFTKAYTHYSEGTGSIFTPKERKEMNEVFDKAQTLDPSSEDYLNLLRSLRLRYFSPREVARLMSFPDTFSFPDVTSLRQKYRLLGNSINVLVVGELIKILCS